MRIDSSSVAMAATSTYVEKNTKEESLKMWIGDKRPDFEGVNNQTRQPALQLNSAHRHTGFIR